MLSIDLRENIIPFSLLEIVMQFKKMATGEIIRIVGIEESIIDDLESVLPEGKFELLDVESMSVNSPYLKLKLKKSHTFNPKPKENCHVGSQSE